MSSRFDAAGRLAGFDAAFFFATFFLAAFFFAAMIGPLL
jgi:hypothetical protein